MEMLMEFPNGETPNLVIEVFNYAATLRCADMLHLWMWRTDARRRDTSTRSPSAGQFTAGRWFESFSPETIMDSLLYQVIGT